MAKKKRKSKKNRVKVSAERRLKEHQTRGQTAIKFPEGMEQFDLEKEGRYLIEIIPFTAGKGNPYADEGMPHYERTYYRHAGVGPNNQPYICPAATFDKPCPICEFKNKRAASGEASEEEINGLSPKERQLWLVYDHGAPDKGVQLWEVSFHNFGKLLDSELNLSDEDENYKYFADPEEGYTLRLGVEKDSFKGRPFFKVVSISFKKRKEPISEELLEQAVCLDNLIIEPSYKQLKKVFFQVDEDAEEEEEDEKPARSKKRKSRKEEEEDELENEEEDEGDWEEEEDEGDWEEEEEPDEEEDEEDDWED